MSEQHLNAAQTLVSLPVNLTVDVGAVTRDRKHQLSMEGLKEAANPEAHTFSQVVFTDTPHSYPPSAPITCCYTLTATLQPNPRDWVGIFKVGWSTTKDYHTFVWVEPSLDVVGQESATRQALFREYYLPKDEMDFYQFCYVDSTGQVRGASTPFCFKNPAEQSLEISPEDDLLVITTQEQVEQSVREKAELQKELDQIREENESLKNDLQKEQQEAASLKGQNEEKEKEMSQLVKEMDQMKEQNENLKSILQQQVKETENLKEEMLTQKAKQEEIQQRNAAELKTRSLSLDGASRQNETHAQEKYDRAVMKINQLKEEREELRVKVDGQSGDIAMLNSKLREQERELFKMKDSIQLLQVDLQSSEKEKERLSVELQRSQTLAHNMDDMKRENQELRRRLSQQETLKNCPDDDLRMQCQTLGCQLQDVQVKLAAEREETKNAKRHADLQDKELQQRREQLEKVIMACEHAERTSGKHELQLAEAHEAIADKEIIIEDKEHMIRLLQHEKEELARDNENLVSDMEELRRLYDESTHMQPDTTSPAAAATLPADDWQQQQEAPDQAENLYETIADPADTEEESLVCRHCQECFPFITQQELDQHEQSHRVCPFCTMICDGMDQTVFEDHVYGHEL
ncbi:calcium-binding and coiled-coil domain-containing protein 2 isoform X3 [Sebastes umbrosus]|uniref:calcium-binding and coiled-coil domain-containing protein 2 isoform X3 n=1 Tax=Sebastes umbrosus TaxID=72105 RepID=UPI0018A02697|nr:calcium-binding and coiled-coil domain-containing protein 2 isoform X3 [Sebastes umbrosus]